MKRSGLLILIFFFAPILSFCQADGSGCSAPIPIVMDGISHPYTISSSTGGNLVCSNSGTSPITYFSLVANSSAQKMLLKITGPNNQPVEVAFYNGTSCTNGNLETASSICFYDGHGDWAPADAFVITANKTYILRIKTSTTGTIQILGQYYTPPNNSCLTATSISTILSYDNNATHHPATGITPAMLCTGQLNNTAFYSYTVDATGTSGISLENMEFDNNYQSDLLNLGFSVGLFTGSCAGLTSVACYVGVSANTQLMTGSLPAGTVVYVAVDGLLGSNCDYGIRAINAVILSADLKSFNARKEANQNILEWTSLKENENAFFEIERSTNGSNFQVIGRVSGQDNSTTEKNYQYSDITPAIKSFYRLRMVSTSGKYSYSRILRVDRGPKASPFVTFGNVVTDQLTLQVSDIKQEKFSIKIIDRSGREVYNRTTTIDSGNTININTSNLANGLHYLIISSDDYKEAFPFIRS